MRIFISFAVIALVVLTACEAKKKRKFEGDFEFADEDDEKPKPLKLEDKNKWTYDPNSDLCRPLNCKKKEVCLMKDEYTAVCVLKKELQRSGDVVTALSTQNDDVKDTIDKDDDIFYDSEDEPEEVPETFSNCEACPVVRPVFLCGLDNRTYSSLCRLDYHNCIHHTNIRVACKGFCPCKESLKANRRKLQGPRNKLHPTLYNSDKNGKNFKITPEDFKYDNKHYKYLKYIRYNNELNKKKSLENSFNDIFDEKINDVTNVEDNELWLHKDSNRRAGCTSAELDNMADRLLDWFSVLMQDNGKLNLRYLGVKGFPAECKSEVRWMFGHLDRDSDGKLSVQDLFALEHDEQERCMTPFLRKCDVDHDGLLTKSEWCRCLRQAARPCTALARRASRNRFAGAYIPQCDSLGYYRPLQCHIAVGMCWCVDHHGTEKPNTRTKGEPQCPDSNDDTMNILSDDEDGAGEGSGDQPLDF